MSTITPDGTREGEFCAIELEDGAMGMSFVLLGNTLARLRNGLPWGRFARKSALGTADYPGIDQLLTVAVRHSGGPGAWAR